MGFKLIELDSFLHPTFFKTLVFLFFSPILMLLFGYYLQYYQGLEPCPLCSFQRGAFILISFFSFFSLLTIKKFKIIHILSLVFVMLSSITGIGIAVRHIYLQNLDKDMVPSCGPDLAYMLDSFPIFDTIKTVLTGSGSCADISWTFLSLSIPEWSLIWFVIFFLLSSSILNFKLR